MIWSTSRDYLTEHYPHLARPTVLELYEAIRSLKTFPQRGRPGREPGTHELVFSRLPYIAVYRIKEQTVEVLHIHHAAQNRP